MRKIERKQKKNMEGEEMKKEKLIIKVNLKNKEWINMQFNDQRVIDNENMY